jgi:hypothetical protein
VRCPRRVIVFGLRGTNESLVGHHGMGPTVATIAERLVAELGRLTQNTTCQLIGIAYPAIPPHWSLVTGAFRASIEAGRRMLVQAVSAAGQSDQEQRIVVVGLSQGAAAVHLALRDLAITSGVDGKPLARSVSSALLYADPLRLAGNPCNRIHDPPHDGVLTWLWSHRVGIPLELQDRVFSFCDVVTDRADPICAFRPGLKTLLSLHRNRTHTTYSSHDRPSGWQGPHLAARCVLSEH